MRLNLKTYTSAGAHTDHESDDTRHGSSDADLEQSDEEDSDHSSASKLHALREKRETAEAEAEAAAVVRRASHGLLVADERNRKRREKRARRKKDVDLVIGKYYMWCMDVFILLKFAIFNRKNCHQERNIEASL